MINVKLNNGVEMPIVGLGSYKATDFEQAKNAVVFALQNGYRHLDTAAFYRNEDIIAAAIKESGIPRDQIFITSKVWVDAIEEGRTKDSFEASLRRLDTDYVDLFLLHWPVSREHNLKAWRVLEGLYKEGRIRAIGVSNYKEKHLEELMAEAEIMPAFDQVELHPDLTQDAIYEYCKSKNIQLGAWSPLGGQKKDAGSLFKDPILLTLADKYNKSVAQIIIRWNIQRGIVVIPKSVHEERIKANIDVFDFSISDEDMKIIGAMNEDNRLDKDPDIFMDYWHNKPEEEKTYTLY